MARSATRRRCNFRGLFLIQGLWFFRTERINRNPISAEILNEQETLVGAEDGGVNMRRFLTVFVRPASLVLDMLYVFFKTSAFPSTENTQTATRVVRHKYVIVFFIGDHIAGGISLAGQFVEKLTDPVVARKGTYRAAPVTKFVDSIEGIASAQG